MKNLYRFFWDCGRQGDVDGLFIATPEQVAAATGKSVYFGEILGKHSEIFGELDADDVEIISSDSEKVAWLEELLGNSVSGYNPLDYLSEE